MAFKETPRVKSRMIVWWKFTVSEAQKPAGPWQPQLRAPRLFHQVVARAAKAKSGKAAKPGLEKAGMQHAHEKAQCIAVPFFSFIFSGLGPLKVSQPKKDADPFFPMLGI